MTVKATTKKTTTTTATTLRAVMYIRASTPSEEVEEQVLGHGGRGPAGRDGRIGRGRAGIDRRQGGPVLRYPEREGNEGGGCVPGAASALPSQNGAVVAA